MSRTITQTYYEYTFEAILQANVHINLSEYVSNHLNITLFRKALLARFTMVPSKSKPVCKGYSLSEALFLASINPKYAKICQQIVR